MKRPVQERMLECRLLAKKRSPRSPSVTTAFGRIVLQNYFEGSDTQDCVAKSTAGETMIRSVRLWIALLREPLPFRSFATVSDDRPT